MDQRNRPEGFPTIENTSSNGWVLLGFVLLLVILVGMTVSLILVLSQHDPAAAYQGVPDQHEQTTVTVPADDATQGLDQDKRLIAEAKAKEDAQSGAGR